ncbi:uncharacterized protein LOC115760079 [Drosophila novamexicana]|uniref:uncharacterized protein LOC115760079 n=1 Tax=Drosophila novamexicana TaxID=47314 RepID=UPI0011E5E2B1|nr:uncharacterized protein LOC115760079 [Drosophila novamexicana]
MELVQGHHPDGIHDKLGHEPSRKVWLIMACLLKSSQNQGPRGKKTWHSFEYFDIAERRKYTTSGIRSDDRSGHLMTVMWLRFVGCLSSRFPAIDAMPPSVPQMSSNFQPDLILSPLVSSPPNTTPISHEALGFSKGPRLLHCGSCGWLDSSHRPCFLRIPAYVRHAYSMISVVLLLQLLPSLSRILVGSV